MQRPVNKYFESFRTGQWSFEPPLEAANKDRGPKIGDNLFNSLKHVDLDKELI
jgi:hypothetical protein